MRTGTRCPMALVAIGATLLLTSTAHATSLDGLATEALASRSWWLLPLAFLAGVISVATPCVLPMLPITLGTLGVRDAPKMVAIPRMFTYVGGIIVTFTALGMIAGYTGHAASTLFTSTATHLALVVLFVALACSAFGLYTLQLPATVQTALSRVGGGPRMGAFLAGLAGGLLALPCTGPVLASILGIIGQQGSAAFGAIVLSVYALGFGTPFLAIGAGLIRMPTSRSWTKRTEHVIGITLLLGAFWSLRNAVPAVATLFAHGAFIGGGFLLAVAGFGMYCTTDDVKLRVTIAPSIACMVLGGAMLIGSMTTPRATATWCEEGVDGSCLASACATRPLTVVDAHAPWCIACGTLERDTLAAPPVRDALDAHGRVRIDVHTHPDFFDRFASRGLPAVTFLDRTCQPVHQVTGLIPPDRFLEHLRTAEALVQ
ncbi:hypothetical protein HY632_04070 [Candidatus Uhrbacteria bacterium]|nr:hypothetical protein [Candidatus Uhrbacteria bacterium]